MAVLSTSTVGAIFKSVWPLLVVAGGGLIAWGSTQADIKQLKQDVSVAKTDHDTLIRVDERTQQMAKDLEEIKAAVK